VVEVASSGLLGTRCLDDQPQQRPGGARRDNRIVRRQLDPQTLGRNRGVG
jgi:hypothetical protein